MSNKLNQLLENAKHESPLLTENDVVSVINNRSLLGKKQTFFTLKNILIMSVLSSIIVGLWMVFYPTATTNLAESGQVSSPQINELLTGTKKKETTAITEPLQASSPAINMLLARTPTTAKANEKSKQVVDSPKKLPAINNKPTTKLFDPIPFTPLFNENPIDDNRNYFDKDGYLILTNEELAKLGIITDGNVLKYENVTDTVIDVFENNNMIKKHTYFGVNISSEGGVSIDNVSKNNREIINNSLNFWPAYITTKSIYYSKKRAIKKVSSFAIVDRLFGNGYEGNFTEEISPLLIPIAVNLKSNNPGKLSTEYQIVFWFKTEELFYNQLGENIAKAAKSDYGISNISQYKIILQKYRNKSRNRAAPCGIDSVTSLSLQKRYIEPQENQYKDLNIFKKKNFFLYKTYCEIDNKTKVLEVKIYSNETTVLENYSKKESFNKLNSKILAVAISDLKIKNITYLKIYPDSVSVYEKMDIEEKYFRENIQKLIPIKVDTANVIWFEPTVELKEIVKIEEKNDSRKIDLTNVKLLEFNEKELLNLGIRLKQTGILIPTLSLSKFGDIGYLSYFYKNIIKDGHVVFDTSNRNNQIDITKKYPIPLLTTNITGFKWLSYTQESSQEGITFDNHEQKIKDKIKLLVPIKIVQNNVSIIAWYEPDSLFLSLLPNTESSEIKTEYNAISNNLPAPSCKYFEVCQNVTGKINSYLAYPNPAEQTLNIEIDLAEERNLEFIITDITGKIIKTLNQKLKQAKGIQTYTYQIGELTEGLYLLIITTDKGEKVSTRIVKK